MTSHIKTFSIVVLAAVGLSGCLSPQGKLDPYYGVSVRQNIAAQIADPDAQYRRDTPPAANGSRAALAQERYNSGQVIQPTTATTSTVGGGGGDAAPATPPAK